LYDNKIPISFARHTGYVEGDTRKSEREEERKRVCGRKKVPFEREKGREGGRERERVCLKRARERVTSAMKYQSLKQVGTVMAVAERVAQIMATIDDLVIPFYIQHPTPPTPYTCNTLRLQHPTLSTPYACNHEP
jgi:hypothetical protein